MQLDASTHRTGSRRTALDNPIFSSLATSHEAVALVSGEARRFPVDIAPFVSVQSASTPLRDLEALVEPDERVFFVGPIPRFDGAWAIDRVVEVHQFRPHLKLEGLASGPPDPRTIELGARDLPEMLDLAHAVYPYFFRARTAMLGTYFGVRHEGRLVAMGGERMRTPGHQEVSTVCTLPEFARYGYASRIIVALARHAARRGDQIFAHCVEGNDPIFALQRKLGRVPHAILPMTSVRRVR